MSRGVSHFLRRPLVVNALSLYAVQGLNYLVPLLLVPYLLRVLGPQTYGTIVLAQAVMGYAVTATDYGFNLTAARDISVVRDDDVAVARIYWTTMAAKAVLLLAAFAVIAALVGLTPKLRQFWAVIACCGVLALGNVAFPQWYLQGLERLRETAAIQALARVVTAVAVVTLVHSPADLLLAAVILSAHQLAGVGAALCLGQSIAPAHFFKPTAAEIRRALISGWHMFIGSASVTLYGYTNIFVLGILCGESAVAIYNVAFKIVYALQSLVSPVIQAVYPRASKLFSSSADQGWTLVIGVARLLMPAIAVASVILAVWAPSVVTLVGGRAYLEAVPVLRILCAIPVCLTASSLLAQCVMVNLGLTRPLVRIYVGVGLLNIAILPGLAWYYAARGAALSLVLAELLGPLLMMRTLDIERGYQQRKLRARPGARGTLP
jgi:PST family polysaccharide transporter